MVCVIFAAEWLSCGASIDWQSAARATRGSVATAYGNCESIAVPAIGSISPARRTIVPCCWAEGLSAARRRTLPLPWAAGMLTRSGNEQSDTTTALAQP